MQGWAGWQEGEADELCQSQDADPAALMPLSHGCLPLLLCCAIQGAAGEQGQGGEGGAGEQGQGGEGGAGGAAQPLSHSQQAAGNLLGQKASALDIWLIDGGYWWEDSRRVLGGSGFCNLRSASSGCTPCLLSHGCNPCLLSHGCTQEWPGLDCKSSRWGLDCKPRWQGCVWNHAVGCHHGDPPQCKVEAAATATTETGNFIQKLNSFTLTRLHMMMALWCWARR